MHHLYSTGGCNTTCGAEQTCVREADLLNNPDYVCCDEEQIFVSPELIVSDKKNALKHCANWNSGKCLGILFIFQL